MSVQRIGVLTSGGDCPGLNAVIRALVKVATGDLGLEVVGIRDGLMGLLTPVRATPLVAADVRGLLPRGGTFLGSSNRGNPLAWKDRDGDTPRDRSAELVANSRALGLDVVVVIGGEGSLAIACDLASRGLPVVGVPKTIDNDIDLTDVTFGFDSAVVTATDALDKLHTTAESHHRVMVVEVMGRHAGWIALAAGVAGGADVILMPEIPFRLEAVAAKIEQRAADLSPFSIVVVAEGAVMEGDGETLLTPGGRLGGIGQRVGDAVALRTGRDTRVTVLGHIQRGGSPSAFDRVLATRFGGAAARLAAASGLGRMVALRGPEVVDVAIADAVASLKRVKPDSDLVRTARGMGVAMGDGAS